MTHANIPIFVPHGGCPHQCSFCNQRTISGQALIPGPEDVRRICRKALETLPEECPPVEIAFFGGSFTAIDRGTMISLLEAAAPFLTDSRIRGIRASTRPDAVSGEILETLCSYGVTAIELGAQSMYNEVLKRNGRGHTAEDVERASALVRRYGISLGLQMMTGLWGSSREQDLETGRRLAELEPDTVRIYPTVVLAGTELERRIASGEYEPPSLEETVDTASRLLELFEARGIRVIRLGLHASELLEKEMVGGGYHPALGELCRSRIWLRRILGELEAKRLSRPLLRISPKRASQIIGQKRSNLRALAEAGYPVALRLDPGLEIDYELQEQEVSM